MSLDSVNSYRRFSKIEEPKYIFEGGLELLRS